MRCNFLLLIQYKFLQWYYFSPQFSSLALHIPFHTFCCLLYLIFFIFKWSLHSCYLSEDQSSLLPKILVIFQRKARVWLLLFFSCISLITFARFNVDLKITFSLTAGNFFNSVEPLFAPVFSHSRQLFLNYTQSFFFYAWQIWLAFPGYRVFFILSWRTDSSVLTFLLVYPSPQHPDYTWSNRGTEKSGGKP